MISMACESVFTVRKPCRGLGPGRLAALALAVVLAGWPGGAALAQVGSGKAAVGSSGGASAGAAPVGRARIGGERGTAGLDPAALSRAEARVLQAALALTGDYVGVLDGAWGPQSRAALEDWARRETGHRQPSAEDLAPLLAQLDEEIRTNGWEPVNAIGTDTAYLFPRALLAPDPDPQSDGLGWISADGGLALVISEGDYADAADLHDYLLGEAVKDPEPFHDGGDDWLATAIDLEDGTHVMARSERARRGFETLVVLADDSYAAQMMLLVASFQRGRLEPLEPPRGSVLAGLMPQVGVQPSREAETAPAEEPTSSGTAFYVSARDLVTAAHVVRGCSEMQRIDGLPLQVLAEDDDLDLAVLRAPEDAADWLDMAGAVPPRLGEPVTALGYPYLGSLGQGLTVTGGNVSALKGIDGGTGEIMISAPVQPGNSGGPLLNAAGAVIGVVVARVDDLAILEETGTLPQNMNFAVPSPVLSDYLDRSGVALPAGHGGDGDLRSGIPDRIAQSVVAVLCYGGAE